MVTSIEQRALAALSTLQEHGMAEVVVTMAETFAITLQAAELEIAAGPKHGQRTGEQLRRAGLNPAERKQYFQDMIEAERIFDRGNGNLPDDVTDEALDALEDRVMSVERRCS